jgi:Ca2+-binding EF-hand superfamily protein
MDRKERLATALETATFYAVIAMWDAEKKIHEKDLQFYMMANNGKFGKEVDIFLWMDKDGDGKVNEDEANIYLKRMNLGGFDKNSSFAYFDRNKDGFLSLREISSG